MDEREVNYVTRYSQAFRIHFVGLEAYVKAFFWLSFASREEKSEEKSGV